MVSVYSLLKTKYLFWHFCMFNYFAHSISEILFPSICWDYVSVAPQRPLSVSSTAFILVFSISWLWLLLKKKKQHSVYDALNSRHENNLAINRSCTLLSRHYLVETVFWYKARLKINIKQFFNWKQLGFF